MMADLLITVDNSRSTGNQAFTQTQSGLLWSSSVILNFYRCLCWLGERAMIKSRHLRCCDTITCYPWLSHNPPPFSVLSIPPSSEDAWPAGPTSGCSAMCFTQARMMRIASILVSGKAALQANSERHFTASWKESMVAAKCCLKIRSVCTCVSV